MTKKTMSQESGLDRLKKTEQTPEFEYTQYDIDMFTKYGDWDDDETGLTQEDIDYHVKIGENPFD